MDSNSRQIGERYNHDIFQQGFIEGRIFKETLPLLKHAGIEPVDDPESSRRRNQPRGCAGIGPEKNPTLLQFTHVQTEGVGFCGKANTEQSRITGFYLTQDIRCRFQFQRHAPGLLLGLAWRHV